jgi:hypothetical protein
MRSPLEFLLRLLLVAGEISDGCVSGGIGDTAGPVAVGNKVDTLIAVGKAEKRKATKSMIASPANNMPPPANNDKCSNTEVIYVIILTTRRIHNPTPSVPKKKGPARRLSQNKRNF